VAETAWEGEFAYLVTLRDITARHRFEQAHRENEKLLSTIIKSTQMGVIAIDKHGEITIFNPAAAKLFKRKPAQTIGKNVACLMPEKYRRKHSRDVESYFLKGVPDKAIGNIVEFEAMRSDGTIFPIEISLSGCREGESKFVVGIARDISARKAAEKELMEYSQKIEKANLDLQGANAKLKELDKLKTDFLSVASHELRTPLTIIREYVALIRDGLTGPINEDQTECLDATLQNCDRLGNLINDILDIHRIESGKQEIHRCEVDIARLVNDCVRDFLPQCQAKNQELKCSLKELPPALCDPAKITQVLVNLIGNAFKFTPEGGGITVSAESSRSDDMIKLAVLDTGEGISETDRARIFDKFTQVNRQDGGGSKGTGLGLSIAQKIVELHDGRIGVESMPGEGSTFYFCIPEYKEPLALNAFIQDKLASHNLMDCPLSISLLKMGDILEQDSSPRPDDMNEVFQAIINIASLGSRANDEQFLILKDEYALAILNEADAEGSRSMIGRLLREISNRLGCNISLYQATVQIQVEDSVEKIIKDARNNLKLVNLGTFGKRVLIVDDDENIILSLRRALKASGLDLEITSTTNGYDACVIFGKWEPDLVILDLAMPDCDGKTVLKIIKKYCHTRNTKFLILSGLSEHFEEMIKLGADDCMTKPYDNSILVDKIKHLLCGSTREVEIKNENMVHSQ
ncbi:MAG: PAS domain S-box protein, partial [candidate division Zixibacteria bacterium]|nr:PAS domain S-box protein [candidate division Zixibacteria bacterium]